MPMSTCFDHTLAFGRFCVRLRSNPEIQLFITQLNYILADGAHLLLDGVAFSVLTQGSTVWYLTVSMDHFQMKKRERSHENEWDRTIAAGLRERIELTITAEGTAYVSVRLCCWWDSTDRPIQYVDHILSYMLLGIHLSCYSLLNCIGMVVSVCFSLFFLLQDLFLSRFWISAIDLVEISRNIMTNILTTAAFDDTLTNFHCYSHK